VANVYFRDMQYLLGVVLQLWFFMTPIVYPLSYVEAQQERLPERGTDLPLVTLFRLNPMERFVTVFRNLLYDARWPSLGDTLYCVGATAIAVVVGYSVFKRFEPRLVEEL
jgi:ABC-2 type transport system permease protein